MANVTAIVTAANDQVVYAKPNTSLGDTWTDNVVAFAPIGTSALHSEIGRAHV